MTTDAILAAVCETYEISIHALRGTGRTRWVIEARMVAIVLLIEMGLSSKQCGRILRRDHTSVLYLERKAQTYAQPMYPERLQRVRDRIRVFV